MGHPPLIHFSKIIILFLFKTHYQKSLLLIIEAAQFLRYRDYAFLWII